MIDEEPDGEIEFHSGTLALSVGRYNAAIGTVVRVDVVALLLLALAAWVHLRSPGGA